MNRTTARIPQLVVGDAARSPLLVVEGDGRSPQLVVEDAGRAAPAPAEPRAGPRPPAAAAAAESSRLRAGRMDAFAALAGGATHEMSNLMATVLMTVEILRGDGQTHVAREVLAALELTTRRGLGIIRQLHLLADGMNASPTLFQPRFLVADLQALVSSTFPRSIVVTVGYPPELWLLEGDPLLLYQGLLDRLLAARDALGGSGAIDLAVGNEWLGPEMGGEAGIEVGGPPGAAARGAAPHVRFAVTARQPALAAPPEPSPFPASARCVGWRQLRASSGPRRPGRAAAGLVAELWLPAAEEPSEELPTLRPCA